MTYFSDSDLKVLNSTIAAERGRVLSWEEKAVQPEWYGKTVEDVAGLSAHLHGLSTPVMTLDQGAIEDNLSSMGQWADAKQVSLAPHGKTLMSPHLWKMQLEAGAWAVTVANEPQLRVALSSGIPRVIVANLLLRPGGIQWLSKHLDENPSTEFFCWVDSLDAVKIMDEALAARPAKRNISVLLEVGAPGKRTGVRTLEQAIEVAQAVAESKHLSLSGTAAFEGVIGDQDDEDTVPEVEKYLQGVVNIHREIASFYDTDEVILTAGGSSFFDVVADVFGGEKATSDLNIRVVVRAGAFMVHDDGFYRVTTPSYHREGPELRPAMNVWSRVISLPEPGIVYLDSGKRDLSFDVGLPEAQAVVKQVADGSVRTIELSQEYVVDSLNDQHARLTVPKDSILEVGDVIRLGLSHPCTVFDKWSLILMVRDSRAENPEIIDLVHTYF